MSRSLLRSAGMMSLAITLSRLTGLLREVTIANRFSTSETDAFWAAFRIPNLLRELLAEGSLNAAFVPVYAEVERSQGVAAAFRLANSVLSVLMIVTGLFGLSIWLFPEDYVYSISSGFDAEKLRLAAITTQFLAPFLLFLSSAAVLMGMANVRGRYFLPAAASACFNLMMVASALWLPGIFESNGIPPVACLGFGSMLGGALQLLVQYPSVYGEGFRFRLVFDRVGGAMWKVISRMGPAVIGVAATYINTLVDTQIASHYGDGPVSYLTYAFRIWLLPIGLFGVAISTVNLTHVSRDAAAGDMSAFRNSLAQSLRMTLLLNVPAAAGLALLAQPIVGVIYQHRSFGPSDTAATAPLLALYALGLPAYALIKLYVPTLYALGRSWLPIAVSIGVIGAKAISNAWMWQRGWDYSFLALTTAIAACLNAAITGWLLRREIGGLKGLGIGKTVTKIGVAMLAMSALCYLTSRLIGHELIDSNFGASALRLGAVIVVGVIAYAATLHLLKVDEAAQLLRRLKR